MKSTWFTALAGLLLATSLILPSKPMSANITTNNQPITMRYNDIVTSSNAIINDGNLIAPAREITQLLQATLEWNNSNSPITIIKGATTISFQIGKKEAYINGKRTFLSIAPYLQNQRVWIPLRLFNYTVEMNIEWNSKLRQIIFQSSHGHLPKVGSFAKLQQLLQSVNQPSYYDDKVYKTMAVPESSAAATMDTAASPTYSNTNIQVQGVDEADIVKTDGTYIYYVNDQMLNVVQAYPGTDMKIIKTISYARQSYQPFELYMDTERLIVIGYSYLEQSPNADVMPQEIMSKFLQRPVYRSQNIKVKIYDIQNKKNIMLQRELDLEGSYVSSRKIGSALYFVANQYVPYYNAEQAQEQQPTPAFRDSKHNTTIQYLNYDDIRYFPQSIEPNYLLLASVDLAKPDQSMRVSAYLGGGTNIYASEQNLYVAANSYKEQQAETILYKFHMEQGTIQFAAQGKVPGTLLNQYSMDEHDRYFRVATTTGEAWRNNEYTSNNNLYILDESLQITGELEKIAPRERIYSVRFMGNRGYMVTFKNVDPLFVLDLSKPSSPKIEGALKIPGYSDYLHPFDENHLIGFGKDTIEMQNPYSETGETRVYYQGLKIALFDITDVNHPIEKFKEIIGDRGTDSEMLHNPKALLFSKENNLLAFPVTETRLQENSSNTSIPTYGQFTFQGGYVYHLDLQTGFQLREKLTHLTQKELSETNGGWYYGPKTIQRMLYIGQTLYAISPEMLSAHSLQSLKEEGRLMLPINATLPVVIYN